MGCMEAFKTHQYDSIVCNLPHNFFFVLAFPDFKQ